MCVCVCVCVCACSCTRLQINDACLFIAFFLLLPFPAGRGDLFCSERSLLAAYDNPTAYCQISGMYLIEISVTFNIFMYRGCCSCCSAFDAFLLDNALVTHVRKISFSNEGKKFCPVHLPPLVPYCRGWRCHFCGHYSTYSHRVCIRVQCSFIPSKLLCS